MYASQTSLIAQYLLLQDPSLTVDVDSQNGDKTSLPQQKSALRPNELVPDAQTSSDETVSQTAIAETESSSIEVGYEIGVEIGEIVSSDDNKFTSERPRLKKKRRKNARKFKSTIDSSALDKEIAINPLVCKNFDYDSTSSTWRCDVCQMPFAQSVDLATHLNTHTDLKRFRCEVCGVRFTKRLVSIAK